jgi:dual specificity protein phosphatase-like protein
MTVSLNKPTNPFKRIVSLLRVGPRAISLRFIDQFSRKMSGAPVWKLSKIRPFLYVGGQHYLKGWQKMLDEGITGIINMREKYHDDIKMGVDGDSYLHLATRDNTPVPIDYLHQAADFIAEQKQQGGKVYVHCGVGVGRAPSAAAAYFIKYEAMTTREALATISAIRPFIHLTGKQRRALEAFELEVRDE